MKTKLKGDFVFQNKTIENNSLREKQSPYMKVKSEELKDNSLKLKDKVEKVKGEVEKVKDKDPVLIEDPLRIPEKWSNAYSNDPKWMELFRQTSNAFLTGWANEFQRNPEARISKQELLFVYRRRMEKIFYETPSFIEFSVNELKNSEQFKNFLTEFQSNIQ